MNYELNIFILRITLYILNLKPDYFALDIKVQILFFKCYKKKKINILKVVLMCSQISLFTFY